MDNLGLGITFSIRDAFTQQAKKIEQSYLSLNKSIEDATKKFNMSQEQIISGLNSIGTKLMLAGGAITASYGAAIYKAMDFGKAMGEVSTLVDTQRLNMGLLGKEVLALSKTYGQLPANQARALYNAISAGYEDVAEAMKLLSVSNKLAVGGVTDVNTAFGGLLASMKPFNYGVEYANKVAAKLFKTVEMGIVTFPQLASQLGGATPLARAVGASLDELLSGVASITVATKAAAGEATTQMASLFAEAMEGIRASAALNKKYKNLGLNVDFSTMALQKKGLIGMLRDVDKELNKLSQGERSLALKTLIGRREGMLAYLTLTGSGLNKYLEVLDRVKNATNEHEVAFSKMSKTLSFQWDQLKATITAGVIQIGNAVEPIISPLVAGITKMVDALNNFMTSFPGLTKFITQFGLIFGVVTLVAGALLTAGAAIAGIGVAFAAVQAAATILFGGIVAAIGGVVAAMAPVLGWVTLAVAGIVVLFNVVSYAYKENLFGLRSIVGLMADGLKFNFGIIKAALSIGITLLKAALVPIYLFGKAIGIMAEVFVMPFKLLGSFGRFIKSTFIDAVLPPIQSFIRYISDAFNAFHNEVLRPFILVGSTVKAAWDTLNNGIVSINKKTYDELKERGLAGIVIGALQTMYRVKLFFEGIGEGLKLALSPLGAEIKTLFGEMAEVFKEVYRAGISLYNMFAKNKLPAESWKGFGHLLAGVIRLGSEFVIVMLKGIGALIAMVKWGIRLGGALVNMLLLPYTLTKKLIEGLGDFIGGFAYGITKIDFNKPFSSLWRLLKNQFSSSLKDGLISPFRDLKAYVVEVCDAIYDALVVLGKKLKGIFNVAGWFGLDGKSAKYFNRALSMVPGFGGAISGINDVVSLSSPKNPVPTLTPPTHAPFQTPTRQLSKSAQKAFPRPDLSFSMPAMPVPIPAPAPFIQDDDTGAATSQPTKTVTHFSETNIIKSQLIANNVERIIERKPADANRQPIQNIIKLIIDGKTIADVVNMINLDEATRKL